MKHTDLARLVNVARHDANLALAGLDDARAIGTDEARPRLRIETTHDFDHVTLRNT